jgi:hypothetical protein
LNLYHFSALDTFIVLAVKPPVMILGLYNFCGILGFPAIAASRQNEDQQYKKQQGFYFHSGMA